jgi:hypothetical protein
MFFDFDNKPIKFKKEEELNNCQFITKKNKIIINISNNGNLSIKKNITLANGFITKKENVIKWNLKMKTNNNKPLYLLPKYLYDLSFPKAKALGIKIFKNELLPLYQLLQV